MSLLLNVPKKNSDLPSSVTFISNNQEGNLARLSWMDSERGRFMEKGVGVELLKVFADITSLPSRSSVSTHISLTLHKDGAIREAALISGRIG